MAWHATVAFAKIANLSATKYYFLNMAGSLAQSAITDFTRLEFYVQAGVIRQASRHLNKTESFNQ